ncbi:site-specific integrase [Aquabacterium soli]|uniref:Site-specific integrase n=2 Tax=Aquabacterium soli TaxID=2493092 RepID=A0A3R8S688_9BURK|nr:site-specific integrase [Aquabacterium soli]RRS03317.1 site-specific integrase [Aquabacterium soli]
MPKKAKELSALEVSRKKAVPGVHFVGGVAGLALNVTTGGGCSWILRYHVDKKRREMGLGSFPEITLARAREKAREERDKLDRGHDPIQLREDERRTHAAARAAVITFEGAAKKLVAALRPGWKNEKHAKQWEATLEAYVYPKIGAMDVRHIALPHVLDVLQPIWTTKTETATRVRSRVEQVIDWCAVSGHRPKGENPARWRGNLDKLLVRPEKVSKTAHHQAVPVSKVGEFLADLTKVEGVGAKALHFAILTATRSGEVRGATWQEFDLDNALWVIPGDRMKTGREHRVPLSPPALALVKSMPVLADSPYVFAAPRGGMLSDMTLSAVMRRMKAKGVPHGFRSTFRDWCAERTAYPRDVCEMALAHTIKDKTEAAYRRGDLFEKRRHLMNDWAEFLSRVETPAKVIPMKKGAEA